ncbi:oxidoreductase-like domain-containing protein [Dyella sp. A6]|uniref:oxidoreductase-like domain-containing protein n=1 Tax=Dyella aluminiiresistens TaxID=3069105 RepID=UPI002E7AA84F|nr:oxidoreductase-like domain-containing protein [Dyella sp. A6]
MTLHHSSDAPIHGDDLPPRRPAEPSPEECCGEGCVPCVYDRYENALDRYNEDLAAWRERHPGVEPDA